MINIRKSEDIYKAHGKIKNCTFLGGGKALRHFDAAVVKQEKECIIEAEEKSELLFVVVAMNPERRRE